MWRASCVVCFLCRSFLYLWLHCLSLLVRLLSKTGGCAQATCVVCLVAMCGCSGVLHGGCQFVASCRSFKQAVWLLLTGCQESEYAVDFVTRCGELCRLRELGSLQICSTGQCFATGRCVHCQPPLFQSQSALCLAVGCWTRSKPKSRRCTVWHLHVTMSQGFGGPRSSPSLSCTCTCITNHLSSVTHTAASASATLLQCTAWVAHNCHQRSRDTLQQSRGQSATSKPRSLLRLQRLYLCLAGSVPSALRSTACGQCCRLTRSNVRICLQRNRKAPDLYFFIIRVSNTGRLCTSVRPR